MTFLLKTAAFLILLPLISAGPARAAMSVIQKAAEASLKCGCTTRVTEGKTKVVVQSVSKSWQQDGKKCRALRIMVFDGGDLIYNGVQKVCEP